MGAIEERNKAIVRRFNEEFIQGHDDAVFEATIADGFVNHSANPGAAPDRDGAYAWFTTVLRSAFPDLEVTVHDQLAEGDQVVTRKSYTGTHRGAFLGVPATGRRVQFGVIDIIILRDGRYVEHWANADLFGLLAQLRDG
ncbi:ester cyclase [Agromyces subbeticus]|uniref:ester cyclase n=1 Tax=Agromyces subbeticus TaxID=293890 RepID=UPI0003B300F5|nr:ester cyclase [Agromyces subbeticus]